MKVYQGVDSFPPIAHAVVTTGTFDGVHLGHKKIIKRLVQLAKERGGETVLFTFDPHPRMILFPEDHGLQLLNTKEEKIELLREAGIDHLVFYPFTEDFSRLSALEYVRDLLVTQLHTSTLVVGYDHHFGRNREGNFELLKEYADVYDFQLEQISALDVNEVNVSSTKVRRALAAGNVGKANSYLGYSYPLGGTVIRGKGMGKDLGYPTANVKITEVTKLIPAMGVYAVLVLVDGSLHTGMLNIGVNPTVSSQNVRSIEVHLFDFDESLYGRAVEVRLLHRLRNEQAFSSVDMLVEQLGIDKRNATEWLKSNT